MISCITYHLIKNPDRLDAELLNVGNIFYYRFTSQLSSRNTSLIVQQTYIQQFPSRCMSISLCNLPSTNRFKQGRKACIMVIILILTIRVYPVPVVWATVFIGFSKFYRGRASLLFLIQQAFQTNSLSEGGEKEMACTPELSMKLSSTLRRIAWALGIPMTKTIEKVFEYLPEILEKKKVC